MKSLLEVYQENTTTFEESSFCFDNETWSAKYLYEQVEKLKLQSEKVCLRHLSLSSFPWSNGAISSIHDYLYHSVRVANADTTIPIIIGHDGYIMDGWHRLAKAVLEGRKTIEAYRFESYVEPESEVTK